MNKLFAVLSRFKAPTDEEAKKALAEVDAEEEARLSKELAERIYEEDIAESVQAKILGLPHHEVAAPRDYNLGKTKR